MTAISEILRQNPIVTAPMAGITDRAFREILHNQHPALVYTEMLSDMALCYGSEKTFAMLNLAGEPGRLAVQLCGSQPEFMGRAAAIVQQKAEEYGNIVLLDINMGCPAPKIVKNGEGSRLMTDPELAARVVEAVVKSVRLPVSVKMRLGWDSDNINVLQLARRVVEAGAQLVTVHGRTRQQFYSGEADWQPVTEVARELALIGVPVIGNGDINSVAVARRRKEESGCAGLMVGRAMMGNPWLIRDLVRDFAGEPALPSPDRREILQMALSHLYREVELRDEYTAVRLMRTHLPFYVRGMPGAAALRGRINQLNSAAEVERELSEFMH